ncbi:MAG: NAD-dependent epimerase/dehydratase family protein [Planctomycetota bacterium]
MTRCLVTGGAGFIGSHLTEALLAAGHEVVVLDDLSTGREANLAAVLDDPKLTFRRGSITDPMALNAAMRDVGIIFHMAAAVGVKLVADDPVRTIETNIDPTDAILRMAALGKQKVFLASTSEVYGKTDKALWSEDDDVVFGPTTKPRWAYGASKAIDEFLAIAYHRKYGLDVVIGRFFNTVGPRQVGSYGMVLPRFVERALRGEPLVVYDDGGQTRCFGYVGEVVDHVLKLMATPAASGEVFNIGGEQQVSIGGLAREVIAATGSGSEIEFRPYDADYGPDFEDIRHRVPDLKKLEKTVGSKPSRPLKAIIDEVIASMRVT